MSYEYKILTLRDHYLDRVEQLNKWDLEGWSAFSTEGCIVYLRRQIKEDSLTLEQVRQEFSFEPIEGTPYCKIVYRRDEIFILSDAILFSKAEEVIGQLVLMFKYGYKVCRDDVNQVLS